jgi:uncharacterized protein
VKLPDVNLLLYAADESSVYYKRASSWLETALSSAETVAFTWAALLGFIRVSTNPAIFEEPREAEEALDLVDGWLAQPCSTLVHPTDRHSAVLRELLAPLGAAGNLTSDAYLAALAIEHGATLYSGDSDFSRFSGLRWVDPLRTD